MKKQDRVRRNVSPAVNAAQSKTLAVKPVKIPKGLRCKPGWVEIRICNNLLVAVCRKAFEKKLHPRRLMEEAVWEYTAFGSPYELYMELKSLKATKTKMN